MKYLNVFFYQRHRITAHIYPRWGEVCQCQITTLILLSLLISVSKYSVSVLCFDIILFLFRSHDPAAHVVSTYLNKTHALRWPLEKLHCQQLTSGPAPFLPLTGNIFSPRRKLISLPLWGRSLFLSIRPADGSHAAQTKVSATCSCLQRVKTYL